MSGTYNNTWVDLESKYDAIPVCLQPYPERRVQNEFSKKISWKNCKIGDLHLRLPTKGKNELGNILKWLFELK